MRRDFLVVSIGIVLLSALIITCKKEYSYEGGPSAEYSIEGAPSTCSPVSIFGSYVTGIALDSTNYAIITADVTLPGKYFISTNTADGIAFSASGTFADTGKHVVYLTTNGIPLEDGNYSIIVSGGSSCNFNLAVKKKAPASYVLSGYPVDCSNPDVQGDFTQYKQLTGKNKVVVNVNVISPGTYTIKTNTADGINFSDSGYFSTTGNQTVTLSGSGTPDDGGLFYFDVNADSSQCSFPVPVTPTFPLGVYVLENNQDTACFQYNVNGNYVSGVPLNNTNTVSFKVYVTDVGKYSIYTKRINGIMFGTSGEFSQIGEQTIILTGSGVPSGAGTFVFSPAIVGPSPRGGNLCNFSLPVQ